MILHGDALTMLKTLPDESVQCCVTSPPYWGLRDYGVEGQLGLEKTPKEYVQKMVEVFREVRRVLRSDGVLWLNLGDSYAGSMKGEGGTYELSAKQNSNRGSHYGKDAGEKTRFEHGLKPKDLVGIPWRVAFALQADGWWLRQDIIWSKPNPMPESVTDRCTKSHEYIFLLTKSAKYNYDGEAIKEPAKDVSIMRLGQDVDNQIGSDRANGGKKTNGKMKAVRFGGNKGCPDSRLYSRKEWSPYQGGGGNGLKGHKGNEYIKNGEPVVAVTANKRSVWTITTKGYKDAHFATFPPEIPELCIKAGSKAGDTVLDPFCGSGTSLCVAKRLGREFVGIELNEKYIVELIVPRLGNINPLFEETR